MSLSWIVFRPPGSRNGSQAHAIISALSATVGESLENLRCLSTKPLQLRLAGQLLLDVHEFRQGILPVDQHRPIVRIDHPNERNSDIKIVVDLLVYVLLSVAGRENLDRED